MSVDAKTAGILAIDIMRQDFHRPFIDGKCNRQNIEDAIIEGIASGKLEYYVSKEIAELAMDLIDDLIVTYGTKD